MKTIRRRSSNTLTLIATLLLAGTLSACGGGGSGGTNAASSAGPTTAHYSIGGSVSGLAAGEQVTLQNNGANSLTVSANGTFTFTDSVAANGSYAVTVSSQPVGQVCSVTGGTGSGSGVNANVGNVSIACSYDTYSIGGTVSGLAGGEQVTLLNNGANALTVNANGAFAFTSPVAYNGSYAVTVSGQPTGQICSVTGGTGSGSGVVANVGNVGIACSYDIYTIGGTVTGLASGAQVTLVNNGGNALRVSANGTFTFSWLVAYNGSYAVTVSGQPNGQTCSVTGGTGSGSGVTANVGNVSIACSSQTYTIGGNVTGLAGGAQVTLLDNGANALTVNANGAFTFSSPVAYNGSYAVTVSGQPTAQTCSVTGGTGSGSGVTANVGNVSIACSSQTYTIGGNVTGLASGAQVTLLNNGANALTVNTNGAFTFTSPVAYNGSYAVTVSGQPTAQTCSVTGGTGSGSGVTANVGNVSIVCSSQTYTIGGNVTGLAGGAQVTLLNNGANALTVSANGAFAFTSPVAYNGSYAVTVSAQPTGQTCSVTGGTGSGSGVTANVGNVSIVCSSQTYTIGGTVTGLASGHQVTLLDNGGDALALTANGAFQFATRLNGAFSVTVGTQSAGQTCLVGNGTGAANTGNVSNVSVTCSNASSSGGSGPAAALAKRLGLPNRFLIGLGSGGSDTTLIQSQGLKPDIYERYLVGIDTQGGWTTWNSPSGAYATYVMAQADSVGAMPMFTIFQFSHDSLSDLTDLNTPAYMQAYWSDAITLFNVIRQYGKPVLVSVEPDFFGFAQAVTNGSYHGDPTKVPAVLSTDAACSSLPPNLTSYAPCLLNLARKYAPKAAIGFPPASWGGTSLASVISFMNQLGTAQGDFLVMQTLDRDAGCPEQAYLTPATAQADCVRGQGSWYWDETNQTHPNFQDNFDMTLSFHNGIGGLPVVWWQTPFGVPSATPGGTAGHYRDNRVDYFLKHPSELVAVGGLAVVFGAGAENQTTPATDGGQYQNLSVKYLANPAVLP